MKLRDQDKSLVVALIARGDSYKQIQEAVTEQGGTISTASIVAIKRNNPTVDEEVKAEIINQTVSQAKDIYTKSQNLLSKKLDEAEHYQERLEEIETDWQESEQLAPDRIRYQTRLRALRDVTISELVQVSKEAYNQSQIGSEDPKSPLGNERAQVDMMARLIKSGDMVELQRIIFKGSAE